MIVAIGPEQRQGHYETSTELGSGSARRVHFMALVDSALSENRRGRPSSAETGFTTAYSPLPVDYRICTGRTLPWRVRT